MEKIGYIYLTTNLVNGKKYVGQHLSNGFDTTYKGSGTYINNAINKYGWDNFNCEIICWCSNQTQLNEAEDNYIKLLNTMVPNGYNLRGGGSHGKLSEESRVKMSEAKKKYFANEENRKKQSEAIKKYFANEENRKKLSEAAKGRTPGFKGKHHTKESRKKMSGAHDKYKKKVLQFTKEDVFVKEWASTNEIERVLGYDQSHISACCLGKQKSAYGYIWRYVEE